MPPTRLTPECFRQETTKTTWEYNGIAPYWMAVAEVPLRALTILPKSNVRPNFP
jgi:hypothetical protein